MASDRVSIESPSIWNDRTALGGTFVPVRRAAERRRSVRRGPTGCAAPCQHAGVIVVAGEALVDLVVPVDGPIVATPGGAPYNVARGCARLGAPTALLAAVSTDRFGDELTAGLVSSGVSTELLQRTARPTTLAVAELDAAGAATYRFYTEGTSAPSLAPTPLPSHVDVLVTGGLALVLEPMAAAVEAVVRGAAERVLVLVDVNCRPTAATDGVELAARLRRVLGRPGVGVGFVVVKASDEDLAVLRPGVSARDAAEELLDAGAAAVLVTAGAAPTTIVTANGTLRVPVAPVAVVDTIGAGDAFTAAFATWWRERGNERAGLDDRATLRAAVAAAHVAAAVVVGRRGADPPRRDELPTSWADGV
jgi:fructokinase